MKMWLGAATLFALSAHGETPDAPIGYQRFTDQRTPASYRLLGETESARAHHGQMMFDAHFTAASTPEASDGIGLGPLFNAASCDACHSKGARGRGPSGDGPVPEALVIKLESSSADVGAELVGDPAYGRILNTASVAGLRIEGAVAVRYREITGYYYPDGGRWTLREPHYELSALIHGPLAPTTVVKPRLAPALYGVGLLEAVPESMLRDGEAGSDSGNVHHLRGTLGRFGWQAESVSVRDQTSKALALEMGVTSPDRPADDCTGVEADCLRQRRDTSAEVSEESVNDIVTFLRTLGVPEVPGRTDRADTGSELFTSLGCDACHRPRLPVDLPDAEGSLRHGVIAPYTDLRLHDLGVAMADETASGTKVPTRWRTAPLWGLGYRMSTERHPTFLHDGRARSIEEAILWHSGEAAPARTRFMELWRRRREALIRWLETL